MAILVYEDRYLNAYWSGEKLPAKEAVSPSTRRVISPLCWTKADLECLQEKGRMNVCVNHKDEEHPRSHS